MKVLISEAHIHRNNKKKKKGGEQSVKFIENRDQ